jgi:hypothetical protein
MLEMLHYCPEIAVFLVCYLVVVILGILAATANRGDKQPVSSLILRRLDCSARTYSAQYGSRSETFSSIESVRLPLHIPRSEASSNTLSEEAVVVLTMPRTWFDSSEVSSRSA